MHVVIHLLNYAVKFYLALNLVSRNLKHTNTQNIIAFVQPYDKIGNSAKRQTGH